MRVSAVRLLTGLLLTYLSLSSLSTGLQDIEDECVGGPPINSCLLPENQHGNQHNCTANSRHVCKKQTYLGEGSVCRLNDETNLKYHCVTGKWTLEGAGSILSRHKRDDCAVKIAFMILSGPVGWISCIWLCPCDRASAPPPNNPPEFESCPDDTEKIPQSGKVSVTWRWSAPTATDPDGETPTVTQTKGPKSGKPLEEGFHAVAYTARDKGGLQAYCNFYITVKVPACDRLYKPQNGEINCNIPGRPNIHGSTCTFTCNEGYVLKDVSRNSVTCQKDETWSNVSPECTPVSCGNPGLITGGQLICPNGHVFNRVCFAYCDRGYQLSDGSPPTTRCQADRSWTSPLPTCVDNEPPQFPDGCPPDLKLFSGPMESPVNISWTWPRVTDNSGQSVNLSSDHVNGEQLGPGIHIIKISATDTVGNINSCRFITIVEGRECPALIPPAHGVMQCTSSNVEGSECTVTCMEGHELRGNSTLTCLETRKWDSELPQCQAVKCGSPHNVSFGSFVCSGKFEYQTVCLLACDQGYSVRGSGFINCLANGSWSAPGSCHDIEPPVFDECPENVEVFGSRLGEETHATWELPRVSDNSGKEVQLTGDYTPGATFPTGVTTVTYTATDVSGNTKRCQFSVTVTSLACGLPELETHQNIMMYSCPEGEVYGATCQLSCSYGFPLTGASTITCEADNTTYPPDMQWAWTGPIKPACIANNCTKLAAPANGALACNLGNFGWDCLMSCNENWDVPAQFDGHFYCTNSQRFWTPSTVPDCTIRITPFTPRLHSKLFYYTGSCNASLEQLKENFITRMKNSTKLRDACVNVPSCVVENVKVQCGPITNRRKRSAFLSLTRDRRQAQQLYVTIDFDIRVEGGDSNTTSSEFYQELQNLKTAVADGLKEEAQAGYFNFGNLTADQYSVVYPSVEADCPAGTVFVKRDSTTQLSCSGCGAGHYLPEDSTQCEPCPVGSYTELDNATSCTPCPQGWSTPTTGSVNSTACKRLCTAGTRSRDGYSPCQPCPLGTYQSRTGATTCDMCPTGTWTVSENATGQDQCIAVDVHLRTRHLSVAAEGGWTSLTLTAWHNLKHNGSANITFQFENIASFSLFLYSEVGGQDAVSENSGAAALIPVSAETWAELSVTIDPQSSNISVFHQGFLVQSFMQAYSLPTPGVEVTFTPLTGKVVLSGLHGATEVVTPPDPPSLQGRNRKCLMNASASVLSWTPSPSTLYMPSECDAVDECLQNPCGLHPCENLVDGFACRCQDGWSGDTCSTPPDPCYNNDCREGSTCLSGATNYTCVCLPGFTGLRCDLMMTDGNWGEWSKWSDCSATCGGGEQHRQRLCNNPAPINGGADCIGSTSDTVSCGAPYCPVNGNWSQWSDWTACSATCNGGERTRRRECSNPSPQYEGADCEGGGTELEMCNTAFCPQHGGFGSWSYWTPCSVTCGDGFTSRQRFCDNPAPAYGGNSCFGDFNETVECNNGQCPVCSHLSPSGNTTLVCSETPTPYLKTCNLTCAAGYVSTVDFPLYECGEKTGYLWNHQRNGHLNNTLPSCTKPKTANSATMNQSVPMNASCDDSVAYSVRTGVEKNSAILPCVMQNACTSKITTSCNSSNRNGSAKSLVVHYELSVRFERNVTNAENDSKLAEEYAGFIRMADESVGMLVQNETERIFAVEVEGKKFSPDVASASFRASLACPEGTILQGATCTDCPAGYKEENGECVPCPLGQYQDQPSSTYCKPCPEGTMWDVLGAVSIDQCIYTVETDTTPTATQEPTTEGMPKEERRRLNIPAIVGGAFAAVVVVVAVVVAVLCVAKKRRASRPKQRRTSIISVQGVPSRHGSNVQHSLGFTNETYEYK